MYCYQCKLHTVTTAGPKVKSDITTVVLNYLAEPQKTRVLTVDFKESETISCL